MSNDTPLEVSDENSPTVTTPLVRSDHNINYLQNPYFTHPDIRRLTSSGGTFDNSTSLGSSAQSESSIRRPFHYPPDQRNVGRVRFNGDSDASIMYNRVKYYNRLMGGYPYSAKLKIPDHVIPFYFLIPRIPLPIPLAPESMNPVKKQNSIVTIFAIWNMLMGTSLLCLPWALHKAGLLTGIIVLLFMVFICFYTADLIIAIPKLAKIRVLEFSDAVYHLLGRWAHVISIFSSLTTITGGCIVYWVLLSNFMYQIGTFIYEVSFQNMTIGTNFSEVICVNDGLDIKSIVSHNTSSNTTDIPPKSDIFYTYWDLDGTVPFIMAVLLTPVITLKSVNLFMKFNVVGSLSVTYLLIFSAYKCWKWGIINIDVTDLNSPLYTPLNNWEFPTMTGVLSLALFIHNLILSLLSTQKNPENNRRDLGIAYVLVGFTYLFIGCVIYLSFPISKDCIRDNFLNNFQSNDILAFVTRVFLFFQVVSLFPLLVYMLRLQVMHLVIPHTTPGYIHILSLNVVLITVCIAFAVYFPRIGTIIRYTGAFSGFVFIFSFPPLAYLKAKKISGDRVSLFETIFLYMIITFGFCNCLGQFLVK